MSIRLATISDAEIIRDIYQAAITAIPQRPDINPKQRAFWLASGSQVSSWETAIGNFTFAVYVENSNVVGFTALHNDYIKYLYVHPNNSGNGIADKLIDWVETTAKNNGVIDLYVESTGPAHRLFSKRGFEKINEIGKNIPNTSKFTFHHFKKNLESALAINKAEDYIKPSVEVLSN
jgi:N-acetylglutamate synthase-like GNAT family acetyltransferase